MRRFRNIGVLIALVFALSAVAAQAASAQSFEASKVPGHLKGHAISSQVFNTNGGAVACTGAETEGEVTESPATDQEVTVRYTGCTAFGIIGVEISPAEYDLHAAGTVDVLNTITINVSGLCSVTVGPQKGLEEVSYENNGGKIIERSAVSKIKYTSSGGLCGASGENGTYTGENEVEEEGGSLTVNP